MAFTVLAGFALAVAIALDGHGLTLPKSAQRVAAIVAPGKYLRSSDAGGVQDMFRKNMREQALVTIRADPVFGRKGYAMDRETTVWIHFGGGADRYAGIGYSGNWHSTWFGMAADFGIPGMLLFALFFLPGIALEAKSVRLFSPGTYAHAAMLFLATDALANLVFSMTTSFPFATLCERYGYALALLGGVSAGYGAQTRRTA